MKRAGLVVLTTLLSAPPLVWAGPGHDHGEGAVAVIIVDSPQRLPDGSVFLPKRSQRQLGIRTLIVESKEVPRTVELAGRVVQDPNAGGRVQSMQAGRIEPGPRGLPALGQAVKRGEVLGYVMPSITSLDSSNQRAQVIDLRAQRDLAERRLNRLRQLEGTVATKDVEAAESDVRSLGERMAAVQGSLGTREALVAPVSGVIAVGNAVAGQVIDARDIVFEIIDPSRLRIEALAFDPSLARNIAEAFARTTEGATARIEFIGAGGTLRDQALPLAFRLTTLTRPTAIGELVTVIINTRTRVRGVPVPSASIVKSNSNEDIAWVHEHPERFAFRRVRYVPLDGSLVAVTDGLKAGDRVVVQSATLLNQVR